MNALLFRNEWLRRNTAGNVNRPDLLGVKSHIRPPCPATYVFYPYRTSLIHLLTPCEPCQSRREIKIFYFVNLLQMQALEQESIPL